MAKFGQTGVDERRTKYIPRKGDSVNQVMEAGTPQDVSALLLAGIE